MLVFSRVHFASLTTSYYAGNRQKEALEQSHILVDCLSSNIIRGHDYCRQKVTVLRLESLVYRIRIWKNDYCVDI